MGKNKYTSPKNAKRGCLCADDTYSSKCCQGELSQQGIGSLVQQSTSTIINENGSRTIISQNG